MEDFELFFFISKNFESKNENFSGYFPITNQSGKGTAISF